MKKLYKLGLASVLALSLAACSASGGDGEQEVDPNEEVPGVGLEEQNDTDGLEEDPNVPTTGDVEEDADVDAETDADATDASDDATLEEDAEEEQ